MNHWQSKIAAAVVGVMLAGMAVAQTSVLREAEQRDQQRQANAEAEFMRQAGRHFVVVAPGVVRDNRTKLEWMRCSMGQDWNERSQHCDGTAAEYTFDGAQAIARRLNQAGGYNSRADWRVPSKDELASLVVCSKGRSGTGNYCADGSLRPTIAQRVFPGTPTGNSHWTSSSSERSSSSAWFVGFTFGDVNHDDYNRFNYNFYVRLVRSSQ